MAIDYEMVKQLAKKEKGIGVADFLALAPKNDPFYVGSPGQVEKGEGFGEGGSREVGSRQLGSR